MRANTVLRWVHLAFGLVLSYYFLFKPDDGWSPGFENFVAGVVMAVVAWTGIIKWQLPRFRRWRRRRRNAATGTTAAGTNITDEPDPDLDADLEPA